MGGLPFPEEERGMGGGGIAEVGNRRLGGEERKQENSNWVRNPKLVNLIK